MSARDELFLHLPDTLWLSKRDGLIDAHRTEVLAEVTTWLTKKAREFHVSSRKAEREQGDTCAVLASKIARGAIRPDNQRMLPNAGFFEVDHTYTKLRGTWLFQCDAITVHPEHGTRTAFGWLRRNEKHNAWVPNFKGDSAWEHDGWTDVTESGDPDA